MKRIGTFLLSTLFIAGAILGGVNQSGSGMGNVYATSSDANKQTMYYATPRLQVTGRDIKGDTVKAGEEFEMVIHLKNESNSTKIRNVSMKLSSEENQIVTSSGSDSIYIETIDKEEETDVTVKMISKADLEQKNYSVDLSYTYEDNNKNTFEDTASLSVPVVQESGLSLTEKKLSKTEVMVDGKTSLTFKVNNLGLDKLRNVTVDLSGDTIQDISYFVGSVEVGESGAVDINLTPDKVGESPIKINVTYEDTLGNQSTYEDELSLVVKEAASEDAASAEAEESSISPVMIIVIIAVIVVIIIITNVIKKKKQQKYE